jgi:uncharacterized protein (DUF488 family)
MKIAEHTIYTIGHSTHTVENFIKMLRSFGIQMLVDIRRFPASRKYPGFNKDVLATELEKYGINYIHLEDLGGRRPVKKDSINTLWRNRSFQGYADYMQTPSFKTAIRRLEEIGLQQPTAYMCAEALWWRCHRSMVSDYLKAKGWRVLHIMAPGKIEEHHYTSPARIEDDQIFYSPDKLTDP